MHRTNPNIAIVTDPFPSNAGSERALFSALELFPNAPVYTLVHHPATSISAPLVGHKVIPSWINRLPWAQTQYRNYLPLLPLAIEQFDLRGYDLVLSFHYAVAHGAICRPDQLHICYTYTPLRYAWQNAHEYFNGRDPVSWLARIILRRFRIWDVAASARVDHFAAVSHWTADCIRRAYGRTAEVIYPPVDVDRFKPALSAREDYYVALSRLVEHKKLTVVVEAFSKMGLPLIVIGQGPLYAELKRHAAPNVKLIGYQSDEAVVDYLSRARALVHAAEEDFGIALVEAQAAGCPVIALGRGGARETVVDGKTGILFSDQTSASLIEAVEKFERERAAFSQAALIANARRFDKKRFQQEFKAMVAREWDRFSARQGGAQF